MKARTFKEIIDEIKCYQNILVVTYKGEGLHVGNLMTDKELGDRESIYTRQRGMGSCLLPS